MKENEVYELTCRWIFDLIVVYSKTVDEDEYFRQRFQESARVVERAQTESAGMDFIRAD